MRRRRTPRRLLPWVLALAVVAGVGTMLYRALGMGDEELVALAEETRRGDPDGGRAPDPGAALELLGPLLERDADHYEANFTAARGWGDLRSWQRAIDHLEIAFENAEDDEQRIRAKRFVVTFLTRAGRYAEAIDAARGIVDLDPENRLLQLQHGLALYDASMGLQALVAARFVQVTKDVEDVRTEDRIEAFVTDIWGSPDVDELVHELAPAASPSLRAEVRDEFARARDYFGQAAEVMADFRDYPGFEPTVAKGYVELLLRSGRVFEAHIEASIALRHPAMPSGMARFFRETLARCANVVGEHAIASELYQTIADDLIATQGWAPPHVVNDLVEARVLAEDWAWVLGNHAVLREENKKDSLYIDYAYAAALHAGGREAEARDVIQQPFSTLSLGSLVPISVRAYPERRRAVLQLAHELFSAVGSTSALPALDALLELSPEDLPSRRLRMDLNLSLGRLDEAKADAFALLLESRRDHEDFARWEGISDHLSLQRQGRGLADRAAETVDKEHSLRRSSDEADMQRLDLGGPILQRGADAALAQDPALAWAIIEERMRRNDLERARIELRQLVDDHPTVQEFRFQLGRLLVREGRLAPAVDEFRHLLEAVPSDTETLDLCMRLERSLGRHKEAAELVNAMILQDPLGVGAVRFGQKLLDTNRPDQATALLQRLLRWEGFEPGLDVHLMAGRAAMAMRDFPAANALLANLTATYPDTADVALLGLDLGLAQRDEGVILSAIAYLTPMATALLPDQVDQLSHSLLANNLHAELLGIFPAEVRHLPVVGPALRPLAEASKAVGLVDDADALLARHDDDASLRDRFLLLALEDRAEEATRRLRLQSISPDRQSELDLCLVAGSVLQGFPTLRDAVPTRRLRELGLDGELDRASIELLDAALRLHPVVHELEEVSPPEILASPRTVYPNAGADVARLLGIARSSPSVASEVTRSIILALLAGERPFWSRETLLLTTQVLTLAPALRVPALHLARRAMEQGRASEAVAALAHLIDVGAPDPTVLPDFLEALRRMGHDDWGLALALEAEPTTPGVRLVTAECLAERGLHAQSSERFRAHLQEHPEDARALGGLIAVLAAQRDTAAATAAVREALRDHPEDADLAEVCASAMVALPRLTPDAVGIIDVLLARFPEAFELHEAKARAVAADHAQLAVTLGELLARMQELPVVLDSPESRDHAALLRRAASLAGSAELVDLARDFSELALRFEPGVVVQYSELAELELEQGNLDTARRYLEVLCIVNPTDKDPPLALAKLLFTQVGQPQLAAEVIRRAYGTSNMPPSAVEVLAAESYLRGNAQGAVDTFIQIQHSAFVTEDTLLTVARIAFAAGLDDLARYVFDAFLERVPKDHPSRARVHYLARQCEGAADEPTAAALTDT